MPVSALRSGLNEILISTVDAGHPEPENLSGWQLMVASADEYQRGGSRRCPGRSGKSVGGQAFVSDGLGSAGTLSSGEYCVRLALEQRVPEGHYRSPALELSSAGSWNETAAPAAAALPMQSGLLQFSGHGITRSVRLSAHALCPDGTQLVLQLRTGAQPRLEGAGWSEWQQVPSGAVVEVPANHQFAQIEVVLSTTFGLASPTLHALSVYVMTTATTPTASIAQREHVTRVVGGEHFPVVRPSVPFTHEDFLHKELKQIRSDWDLDAVVEGTASEFEA